jgi:hypothetical protein
MKDPCKKCLVIACCADICEDKTLYNTDIRNHFEKLCAKHLYSPNSGKKRKHLSKEIRSLVEYLRARIIENKKQDDKRFQLKTGIILQ